MIRAAAEAALAVLIAPACAACDQPLEEPLRSIVCRRCWASVRPIAPPLCACCGDPLPWSHPPSDDRCAACRATRRTIGIARAAAEYDGTMRAIVHALKYGGRRSVAPALGALMRARGGDALTGADFAVPVPLHWRRRWSRGFNQAAELAKNLGLPVVEALVRRRPTPPQADLPAARRRRNVEGAFAVRRRSSLSGARVVLVDDVSTTGATLDACASALWEAGVRDVRAVTAARAVRQLPHAPGR